MVINLRQNTNDDLTAYRKYFAEIDRKEPMYLRMGICREVDQEGDLRQ